MDVKRIHETLETLTKCVESEFAKGIENIDTEEMGKVVDMVKDLAEAQYYANIYKEMKEAKEEEEAEEKSMLKRFKEEYGEDDGKRFYDSWRRADGRFARKGTGEYRPRSYYRRGFDEPPYYHMTPEMYRNMSMEEMRDMDRDMGKMYYSGGGSTGGNSGGQSSSGMSGNSGSSGNMGGSSGGGSTRGYEEPMRGYRDGRDGRYNESRSERARRNYTETKEMHKQNTPEDKETKMRELEKYLKELSGDITDMISDASNEEKNLLKQKMSVLVQKIQ